jgi:hypothetical protein
MSGKIVLLFKKIELYYNCRTGDVNADGVIDVGDIVCLINYLFRNGTPPLPSQSGDLNCDGEVNVADLIYLINYLFKRGLPPSC